MRRHVDPNSRTAITDEFNDLWDEIKRLKFSIQNLTGPGVAVTFVQQTDPGVLDFPYVWYEVNGAGVHIGTHVRVP